MLQPLFRSGNQHTGRFLDTLKSIFGGWLTDHSTHVRVIEDVGQSFPWIAGIQRHIARTSAHHPNESDDHANPPVQTNAHKGLRTDQTPKASSQGIGSRQKFQIGQRVVTTTHSLPIWCPFNLVKKPIKE